MELLWAFTLRDKEYEPGNKSISSRTYPKEASEAIWRQKYQRR